MIEFRKNTAQYEDIVSHLIECDSSFIPVLSSRVDLPDFSKKIHEKAEIFEAWDSNKLIGFISCYYNNQKTKEAFINNVSVLADYTKQGIAQKLLDQCLEYGQKEQFLSVMLEVFEKNEKAINLYVKAGFQRTSDTIKDMVLMRYDLQKG